MKDDELAKRMFIGGGCLLLPFLWMLNTLDNYERVFGKAPWPASLCCSSSENHEDHDSGESHSSQERIVGTSYQRGDANVDENDASNLDNQPTNLEELKRWVRFSSIGSFVSICAFVAWTLVFQLLSRQRNSIFGPNWFVMSEDEEELTGW